MSIYYLFTHNTENYIINKILHTAIHFLYLSLWSSSIIFNCTITSVTNIFCDTIIRKSSHS